MLYIVLVLVLAAFGLLIAALTTANTLWAWISVGVSVVAAALLIMDWLGGRKAAKSATEPADRTEGRLRDADRPEGRLQDASRPESVHQGTPGEPAEPEFGGSPGFADPPPAEPEFEPEFEPSRAEPAAAEPTLAEPTLAEPALAEPALAEPALAESAPTEVLPAEPPPPVQPDPDSREPDEEPTDAADLLIVAGLSVEVHVVDEHPRYHLTSCTWLSSRPTIPIAVSEARQLGFTPCVRCGPDATLAAKHRANR